MRSTLRDKTALVTASSTGSGLETAEALAGMGATVIVNGHSAVEVEAAIAHIQKVLPKAQLVPLVADTRTDEGYAHTTAAYISVDILIDNLVTYQAAGLINRRRYVSPQIAAATISRSLRLAKHYLSDMARKGDGQIVFISSENGYNPTRTEEHDSATALLMASFSHGIEQMTHHMGAFMPHIEPGLSHGEVVRKFAEQVFPYPPFTNADLAHFHRPPSLRSSEYNICSEAIALTATHWCLPWSHKDSDVPHLRMTAVRSGRTQPDGTIDALAVANMMLNNPSGASMTAGQSESREP